MDDPAKYVYQVQVLEEEKQPGYAKNHEKNKGKETSRGQWSGSLIDVQSPLMRYDSCLCPRLSWLTTCPATPQPRPSCVLEVYLATIHS